MPKKAAGWREPLYFQPPRVRSPSPVAREQVWSPRSPTAGETAPSSSPLPPQSQTYIPSGYPLDLHVASPPSRHVYYGEVSRPPDSLTHVELLHPVEATPTLEVVHHDVQERIVQVHIPEIQTEGTTQQYYTTPSPSHKLPLFYNGKLIIYIMYIYIFIYAYLFMHIYTNTTH